MPFALITIGIVLFVTGFQNTYQAFGKQVKSDFTGSGNFFYWVIAIGIIGSVGYVPAFRNPSRVFLALIITALFLRRQGFFDKLVSILPDTNNQLVSGGGSMDSSAGASGSWGDVLGSGSSGGSADSGTAVDTSGGLPWASGGGASGGF